MNNTSKYKLLDYLELTKYSILTNELWNFRDLTLWKYILTKQNPLLVRFLGSSLNGDFEIQTFSIMWPTFWSFLLLATQGREVKEEDIINNYSSRSGKLSHYSNSYFIGQHNITNLLARESQEWVHRYSP